MNKSVFPGLIFLSILFSAQGQATNPLSGRFQGDIFGTASILAWEVQGNRVQGTIDADGYIYNLEGSATGNDVSGKLSDPNYGGVMDYSAFLEGDKLTLLLEVPDQSGQTRQVELAFSRTGTVKPDTPGTGAGVSAPDPPGAGVERDQRLVGGWRYTDTYTSGSFGAVSETYMQLRPDGTYRYGDSQVMGGGAGSSFDSGRGDAYTGQWKTRDGVVYINEGYGWQPYATYIVDSNSMLFKFDDGSKQLWDRYQ